MLRVLAAVALSVLACPAPAQETHPLDRAEAVLAAVVPHVETACGARFAAAPRVVELTPREAADVFAEDLRPEFDRRYATLPERHRAALLRQAATTSVASALARYSFSRKETVVVREAFDAQCTALGAAGDRAAALLTVSLAHEAVHALDDARFDLAKLYRGAKDDEAVRAVAMVAEGRAVHFGRVAAVAAGAPADVAATLPGGPSPKSEREWHLHLTYRLGARFVAALVARGGTALADAAIATPPETTWHVCAPERWPSGVPDARPAGVLERAGLAAERRVLSQLQLIERYAAMKGLDDAEALFRTFAGGAQALVGATNCAVLAFGDEDAAKRYEETSRAEAPTARRGTIVVRAMGADRDAWLPKLGAATE